MKPRIEVRLDGFRVQYARRGDRIVYRWRDRWMTRYERVDAAGWAKLFGSSVKTEREAWLFLMAGTDL